MIATPHSLASGAGLDALKNGGSAVDAAIAANAVLCVGYPHMAGLGGDGFWLVADPDAEQVRALNASGPAAEAATRTYYTEQGYDEIPTRGPEAALTVPGAVDGWRQVHEAYGQLAWSRLFDDAVEYAREGIAVGRSLADWLVEDESLLSAHPSAGEVFLPDGDRPKEGELIRQPALADSLETLADEGPRDGFYEGEIGGAICDDLGGRGSPLAESDFADFEANWVEPCSTTYRDHTVHAFPPNTQGFTVLEILNLIEAFDVEAWGDNTADYYHHLAEAVKVAFADRDAWLTDPEFVDIPLEQFTSKAYADDRRGLIDAEHSLEMGVVDPGIAFDGEDRTDRTSGGAGGSGGADGDTVAFSAVDSDGLAVSAIQSIYHDFGSAEIGGDTGIILQNRGSFFSLDESHPNRLEPGKRTFHTLMPGMVTRDGEPYLAYGTMGGEGQPQTQAAVLTRLIDFGYDVQQAIEAPRWLMGRTWGAESNDLSLESRISDEVMRELAARGQPVKPLFDWDDNMGHAQAIRIDPETGQLEGGADPRGDGAALGY